MILDNLFHLFEPASHLWLETFYAGGEPKTRAALLGWHGCYG